MAEATARTIMVSDFWSVPAVPDATLAKVFGNRPPDPKVEHVELLFEYWNGGGNFSRFMLHDTLLTAMRGNIDAANMGDFLSLMVKRKMIDDLVSVMSSSIDRRGDLRAYMEQNGADFSRISYYASWGGVDGTDFFDGFVVGVAASFATIVIGIWDLVKVCWQVSQWFTAMTNVAIVDPRLGAQALSVQVQYALQMIDRLIDELQKADLPEWLKKQWREWNDDFLNRLSRFDSRGAGEKLGRLGGDIWQMVTGIIGLAKLLSLAGKLSLKFAPLIFATLRRTGKVVANALRLIADVLVGLGSKVVNGLAKVGLGTLRTLFPPELIEQVYKQGRALLQWGELSLVVVPQPAYAAAYGTPMGQSLAMMVVAEGKPVMMAATSDTLPTLSAVEEKRLVDEVIQAVDANRDVDAEKIATVKQLEAVKNAAEIPALAEAMDKVENTLQNELANLVQKVSYDEFRGMYQAGERPHPGQLGNAVDSAMAKEVPALLAKAAPGAAYDTQKQMRTVLEKVTKLTKRMRAVLEEPVGKVLARNPHALDLLGVGKDASQRTPESVTSFVKRFGWEETTKVGDLKSDLLVWDPRVNKIINVDWTSATKLKKYEALTQEISKDLGKTFAGDWANLEKAYQAAGKEMPKGVLTEVAELRLHALRETIARRVLLQEVLGSQWRISSVEMLYDGINLQYDLMRAEAAEMKKIAAEFAAQLTEAAQ